MGALSGKYAVVTGAAKGLGKAIAKRFIEDGVEAVAIMDLDLETAAKTAEELGEKAYPVECNVAAYDDVADKFAAIYADFGRIDILVNNAGITRDATILKLTAEQWTQVINVDLNSAFYCIKQVVNNMKSQSYGKIVNVSSLAAFGNPGQANYAAAKAGVIGLTCTVAKELAGSGITVNAICPSLIKTDIIKTIPEDVLNKLVAAIPAKRVGEPEEVASVVSFLASDDSSYVTGQVIRISGGVVL